jgi:hypothetical protein
MPDTSPITLFEVQRHIEKTLSEIVVVVEAIDPQLSGTFQAVQSYRYEDIVFGADFEKCLFVKEDSFTVDMRKFHGVEYDESDFKASINNSSDSVKPAEEDEIRLVTNEREEPHVHFASERNQE